MEQPILNDKGKNNPRHPLYRTWASIKNRCYNKMDVKNYAWYGGRGIKVCDRWLDRKNGFVNFVNDMGEKPKGYSIDRIDVNGPYSPDNCRWVSSKEQAMNKRNNVHVNINGEVLSPFDVSVRTGLSEETIRSRIRRGITGDDILLPLGKGSPIKIKCVETGEEYPSMADASRRTGIHKNSFWSFFAGKSKTAGGFHWKKVENADEVYKAIKELI